MNAPQPILSMPEHRMQKASWVHIAFLCGVVILIIGLVYLWMISTFITRTGRAVQMMSENPAMETAKILAKENAEWEIVRAESQTGEISFRNKKTKQEATISYQNASSGNFSMKGTDGSKMEMRGGKIEISNAKGEKTVMGAGYAPPPEWIPSYPRVARRDVILSSIKDGRPCGSLSFQTEDTPPQVKEFYAQALKDGGWTIDDATQIGLDKARLLMLKMETGKGPSRQTFNIMASRKDNSDNSTAVQVIWEGPKKS
jgi:hypothetical protein